MDWNFPREHFKANATDKKAIAVAASAVTPNTLMSEAA